MTSSLWHYQSVWNGFSRCHGTSPESRSWAPWTTQVQNIENMINICHKRNYHDHQITLSLRWRSALRCRRLTCSCGSCRTPSRAPSCCSGCRTCRCTCDSPDTGVCCSPGTWRAAGSGYKASRTSCSESPAVLVLSPPSQSYSSAHCKRHEKIVPEFIME